MSHYQKITLSDKLNTHAFGMARIVSSGKLRYLRMFSEIIG